MFNILPDDLIQHIIRFLNIYLNHDINFIKKNYKFRNIFFKTSKSFIT